MADEHLITGSEEKKPPAPPIQQGENLEKKPDSPHVQCSTCKIHQEEMENEAEGNLFKIQALAQVIIERIGYLYNKRFCCSEEEAKDFGDEEEITLLFDIERFAEMISEKVKQVHQGIA